MAFSRARPDVKVLTAFSGDWSNVPRAREVTAMQIERGADIIVMNAGGHLYYEDREGGGARFVIELPHTEASHAPGEASAILLSH